MKKRCFILFIIMAILPVFLTSYLSAQPVEHERVAAPAKDGLESEGARIIAGFEFEPLEFDPPEVDRVVLENGMIVYLLEDHDLPLFDVVAKIKTGAIYEPPELAGLASLTGHVMRSGGTISMPADTMNRELEFIAASVETSIDREAGNASLSVLKKDMDRGLAIFADVLMNPAFPEDKIQMRKDEIIESIRRENDHPSEIVRREFRKIIYEKEHPYSRRVEGTPESLERITRDDIVNFHKKYFYPNNIILGVAGDFNKKEILDKLKEVFAGWEKKEIQFPHVTEVNRKYEGSVNYIYKDINQANVIMGHLGIRRTSPDYFPVVVMNFILGGGGFSSRIPSRIRSDEGLAYSAYSAFQTARDIGVFFVSCQTKLGSTARAISIVLEELKKIRTTPVDEKEINLAKETFINTFIFRFTTSKSIVKQKIDIEYNGLPLNYLENYLDNVRAVTREDILRVAKKYLQPDNIKLLVVGNEEKFDKPLSTFGKVNVIKLE